MCPLKDNAQQYCISLTGTGWGQRGHYRMTAEREEVKNFLGAALGEISTDTVTGNPLGGLPCVMFCHGYLNYIRKQNRHLY